MKLLKKLFPTVFRLLGSHSENPPIPSRRTSRRFTKPHRPHERSEFEGGELNGLNNENELDQRSDSFDTSLSANKFALDQYEVYKLDVMTGGDTIPDLYSDTWD